MLRLTIAVLAGALAPFTAVPAAAQVKVVPGEHRVMTATVEAVDLATRRITIRNPDGELRTVVAGPKVTRLAEVEPGDTIQAVYYDNIVIRLKPAGEVEVDTATASLTPGSGPRPVGTSGIQQTITATIEAIDLDAPSISLKGPRGWRYQSKVQDRKALEQLKVGNRVDITWTEAMLVSVMPDEKK
jgi:hypothetical protein